jgi:hypothetical protein
VFRMSIALFAAWGQTVCSLALLAAVVSAGALWLEEAAGPGEPAAVPLRLGPTVRRLTFVDDDRSVWVIRFPQCWQRVDLTTGRVLAAGRIAEAATPGLQVSRCGSYFIYGDNRLNLRVHRPGTADEAGLQSLRGPERFPNRCELGTGGWIAAHDEEHLTVWRVDEPDRPRVTVQLPSRPTILFWSPDGTRLLVADPQHLTIRDGRTLEPLNSVAVSIENGTFASFSKDGRWVAACGSHGPIAVWDTAANEAGIHYLAGEFRSAIALSPDGARLTVCDHHGMACLIDTADPANRKNLARLPALVSTAGYTADGAHLLFGLLNGDLFCWSLADNELAWQIDAPAITAAPETILSGALPSPGLPPLTPIRG